MTTNEQRGQGEDNQERYRIALFWHYVTFPTMFFSFFGGMVTGIEFFGLLFIVALLAQFFVGRFANCAFCGESLLGRPPKRNEVQGQVFFFPTGKCWNCKKQTSFTGEKMEEESSESGPE